MFKIVDLPEPLLPTMATISFSSTENFRSSIPFLFPNNFDIFFVS
ncbi:MULTISPECIES: hypothetical protein [Anaerococcus]|nr:MULTISPECIES: hypothetical protein [Anaerococcus]MDU1828590.1 hypothetical protein [Anaerococcus sp.]MDU1864659.1 hypothetical protein [Anaerococcus sp.]MDU2353078.1 hypothetical protein [Anaerococcus sp.]MDU2566176.1 hypothetical protein [Anaerococcus sp.]MDU3211934.1 hypothetical protein [Anaerococcus sp.]